MNYPEGPEEVDEVVQFDAYGVKVSVRPGSGEPAPVTWSQVWQRVRRDIRRLVVLPLSLIVEAGEGLVRLIRGISGFPSAINNRLKQAHVLADRTEANRANEVSTSSFSSRADAERLSSETTFKLEKLLKAVRLTGRDADIVQLRDDVVLLVLGTNPEARQDIEAAAERTLKQINSGTGETIPASKRDDQ
jgi:hypothetical protein